jgi:hypothetical protein
VPVRLVAVVVAADAVLDEAVVVAQPHRLRLMLPRLARRSRRSVPNWSRR